MPSKKKKLNPAGMNRVVAEARSAQQQNLQSYRQKALKLFPHVCARCGREFEGKKLRELTVHHKDHNHDNNPPDGSNWELLCIYCHDNEHSRHLDSEGIAAETPETDQRPTGMNTPFADLDKLLKNNKRR
ncbi:MAG: HNH nuclease family protein [Deltaproteobacteria bacterium]|jgi:5-methylcytosine-specific restriction endonuclease McrA|nr:HNH nuclease family protein [Deltaproteobacteria bacterium]